MLITTRAWGGGFGGDQLPIPTRYKISAKSLPQSPHAHVCLFLVENFLD